MNDTEWLRAALVLATIAIPSAAAGQIPDTLTVPLPGLRISVERLATEEGGAARLVVPLDSVSPRIASSAEDVLRATPLIRIRRNARGQAQPFPVSYTHLRAHETRR